MHSKVIIILFKYEIIEKKIILWGNGRQAYWFANKTTFGISGGILLNVSTEEELNKHPNLDIDASIVPAGVQSMYEIQKKL